MGERDPVFVDRGAQLTWVQAVRIRHGMEILLVEREDDIKEDRSGADW